MAKASNKSPEEKLRVVLSVLRGELSAAAAGLERSSDPTDGHRPSRQRGVVDPGEMSDLLSTRAVSMPAADTTGSGPGCDPAPRTPGIRVQASRTLKPTSARSTTGGRVDHGKLIHRSVRLHTYSHLTSECDFS